MAFSYLDNVDLKQNQLLNAVAQSLSTPPGSPLPGQFYYSTQSSANTIVVYNGTEWFPLDARKATNIPLSALVTINGNSLLGNISGSAGFATGLTATQAKTLLAISAGDVSGLTAAIEAIRLDQMALPTANINLNNHNITNLAVPSANSDAATKSYVDSSVQSAASGLDVKDAVVCATTADITLSGLQTIDGVSVTAGERVLVKNQSNPVLNGIYLANTGAWALAADSVDGELSSGALVLSVNGTVQGGTQWYLQTSDPITVGTTPQSWTQFGAAGTYTADSSGGLQLIGSAFSAKLPVNSGLVADSTGLYVNNSIYPRKYSANVGDNSSTTINVTHNLGTQDVVVQLRNNSSPYDVQYATVECTNTTTVTLMFATAPATNALRVTVIG